MNHINSFYFKGLNNLNPYLNHLYLKILQVSIDSHIVVDFYTSLDGLNLLEFGTSHNGIGLGDRGSPKLLVIKSAGMVLVVAMLGAKNFATAAQELVS